MNKVEYLAKLSEIKKEYENLDIVNKDLENAFRSLTQQYLWEGHPKKFQDNKFREIAAYWHTDKIDKPLASSSDDEKALQFAKWFREATGTDPFTILSDVKTTFHPELHYGKIFGENTVPALLMQDELKYPFRSLRAQSPYLKMFLMPMFYALEALEKNLDNYKTEKNKNLAKSIYFKSNLINLMILGFAFVLSLVTYINPALMAPSFLINVMFYFVNGVLAQIAIGFINGTLKAMVLGKEFEDKNRSVLIHVNIMIPYEIASLSISKLKDLPKGSLSAKILAGLIYTVASVASVAWLAFSAIAMVYNMLLTMPLQLVNNMISVSFLVATNAPLLASQVLENPKNAFAYMGKLIRLTIAVYRDLLRDGFGITAGFLANFFSRKQPTTDSVVAKEPKHDVPEETCPYWQIKLEKYLTKEAEDASTKRREFRKQRNKLLDKFGIGDSHPYREQLDEAITQKSLLIDKNGFATGDSQIESEVLQMLNTKAQLLYLQQADNNGKSRVELLHNFPKDLDYTQLEKGKTLRKI